MVNNDVEAFSWKITNGAYCIKKMDKSFYKYGETVIPVEMREYFRIDNNTYGDKLQIKIFYKGKIYDENITFESNFNRSKLRLNKELHEKIIKDLEEKVNVDIDSHNILLVFGEDGFFGTYTLDVLVKVN